VNALWLLFWLILIIVLLGLIFGGYRKGSKVGGSWVPAGRSVTISSAVDQYSSTVGGR
jgi:hypothetical protein